MLERLRRCIPLNNKLVAPKLDIDQVNITKVIDSFGLYCLELLPLSQFK